MHHVTHMCHRNQDYHTVSLRIKVHARNIASAPNVRINVHARISEPKTILDRQKCPKIEQT